MNKQLRLEIIKFLLTLAIPALCAAIRPFSFSLSQSLILGILLQTILCWAANLIHRDIAAAWLLLCFLFIGNAGPLQVFNFVVSPAVFFSREIIFFSNPFIFIIASFLLSTAITKSGLADRAAQKAFIKFAKSPLHVVRFSFIAGALLIFLIPQPFPRVIIMASLYLSFFSKIAINEKTKTVLLFSIFAAATSSSALFINGDVVLNNAAIGFSGAALSYLGWIKYMFVPSLVMMVIAYFVFVKLYGIGNDGFELLPEQSLSKKAEVPAKLHPNEIKVMATTSLLIILWLTENMHGIAAAHSAGIIVIALFFLGVLKAGDLKTVNLSLVLFMCAAYSIGRVLSTNGIAAEINSRIFYLLPESQSVFYYIAITLVVMILHFFLGSVATTLSVVVPTLVALPGADPITMALLAFSVANMQYFLPMHHVTILVGAGKGYYSQKETIKLGICFFFIMLLYVPFELVQWWRLI